VSVLDNEKAEPEIGANGDGLGWVSGWVRLRETRRKPIILGTFSRLSADIVSVWQGLRKIMLGGIGRTF
jgi:hypothetical protein